MSRPWRVNYAGAKYHITSRGNGRERVFVEGGDWQRFLEQLASALEQDEVILYAYVLMPNHYHLLIETPLGNVQRFMQRLNTAYSLYFRYKKHRPGHCFQGRYGAKLVEGDDYLVRLTRYIHLNPIKTNRFKGSSVAEKRVYLNGYRWSSYRGYAGLGETEEMVDYRWLKLMGWIRMSANRFAYRKYVGGMIAAEDEVLKESFEDSVYAIGEEKFRQDAFEKLKGKRLIKGVYGRDIAFADKGRKISLSRIEEVVSREFGVDVEALKSDGRHAGISKSVALELSCQLSGMTQRKISQYFEYTSDSSVGKQRKLLAAKMERDESIARRLVRLKGALLKV